MVERPPMRVSGPVLDTDDAPTLAQFYARLLGWTIAELEDGWARLRAPDGSLKIEIQHAAHYVAPVWPPVPGEQQMMLHLDILTPDLKAGVAWAQECGATIAAEQPQKPGWHVIMRDPAGHVFCMCRDES